jgi:hypothetical protein
VEIFGTDNRFLCEKVMPFYKTFWAYLSKFLDHCHRRYFLYCGKLCKNVSLSLWLHNLTVHFGGKEIDHFAGFAQFTAH